jgi:hypothetical protein
MIDQGILGMLVSKLSPGYFSINPSINWNRSGLIVCRSAPSVTALLRWKLGIADERNYPEAGPPTVLGMPGTPSDRHDSRPLLDQLPRLKWHQDWIFLDLVQKREIGEE